MRIINRVVQNYISCRYKAYLSMRGESGKPHQYAVMMDEMASDYQLTATNALLARLKLDSAPAVSCVGINDLENGLPLILDCVIEHEQAQFHFNALQRVDGTSSLGLFHYAPVMFCHQESVREKDKLVTAFGAHTLGKVQGVLPKNALLMFGPSCRTTKVDVLKYSPKLKPLLADLATAFESPPLLFLNDHCPVCEFRENCQEQAMRNDDLCLLRRMTETQARKLRQKGIFTVNQLSHTYRPRRRSKRRKYLGNPHSFALQALAIRERKIHVVSAPELPDSPVHVFIDMEGDSKGQFIYLIGLLVTTETAEKSYSLWADTHEQEVANFNKLLAILGEHDDFSVFHFGNYESTYFKRMRQHVAKKRLTDRLLNHSVNVLSLIYSNIYFPTYSNSLKDIGAYLGCKWSEANASGLQSLVWRHQWDQSGDEQYKTTLLQYNHEDCVALKQVTDTIYRVCDRYKLPTRLRSPQVEQKLGAGGVTDSTIVCVEEQNPFPAGRQWGRVRFMLRDYDHINQAAYFDYQRDRIYIRTNDRLRQLHRQTNRLKNRKYRSSHHFQVTSKKCPNCGTRRLKETGRREFVKQAFDLKHTSTGLNRRIFEYRAKRFRCLSCKRVLLPPQFKRIDPVRHSVKGWAMYQHVTHQVSFPKVNIMLREFFDIHMELSYVHLIKAMLARFYQPTYKGILQRLLAGSVIHVDETELKLKSSSGYVWVLANMEDVYFFYRPSREGAFLKEMLETFGGVLVSDFYAAYDSVPCLQQKCLVHLIRDINSDVLKNPFDEELKAVANDFGQLLREIVVTIDRWGLRKRYLARHVKIVKRFFRTVCEGHCESTAAATLRSRLKKNKDKLFTFLEHDGVPWNNNNAEHAIKQFAHYRVVADGIMSESGINDYLALLSIVVTCKFKGVSPLQFLMSGERDIDTFAKFSKGKTGRASIELYPRGFPTRYLGKARQTMKQLRSLAKKNNVEELYDELVEVIRKHFGHIQTTVDALVFLGCAGELVGRRILFLVPKKSDSTNGIRYTVYTERFAEHFGITLGSARSMLPSYVQLTATKRRSGEFGGGHFEDKEQIRRISRVLEGFGSQTCK
jgi:predicted RecB family nuclease